MKKLISLCMFAALLIAASCTKEGPQGPAGTNGTNGTNGNANVMYSDWFNSGTWTSGSGVQYFNKAEAAITQTVIDQGVVLAFAKLTADATNVRPLPANTGTSTYWNFYLTAVGNIRFETNFVGTPSTTNQFRYIIIPASTHLRLSKPFTAMSYQEICSLFHIPM